MFFISLKCGFRTDFGAALVKVAEGERMAERRVGSCMRSNKTVKQNTGLLILLPGGALCRWLLSLWKNKRFPVA